MMCCRMLSSRTCREKIFPDGKMPLDMTELQEKCKVGWARLFLSFHVLGHANPTPLGRDRDTERDRERERLAQGELHPLPSFGCVEEERLAGPTRRKFRSLMCLKPSTHRSAALFDNWPLGGAGAVQLNSEQQLWGTGIHKLVKTNALHAPGSRLWRENPGMSQ